MWYDILTSAVVGAVATLFWVLINLAMTRLVPPTLASIAVVFFGTSVFYYLLILLRRNRRWPPKQ